VRLWKRNPLGRRATLWIAAWLAIACLASISWRSASEAESGLFQSDLPTPSEWPTATVASEIPPSATPLPVPSATAEVTATISPAAEPTLSTEPSATMTTPPTETPEAVPEATSAPAPDESSRYPEQKADLEFRWRALADALVLGVSYAWLVCGILLLVLLVALLLWALVRRRRPAPGR